MGRLQNKNGRQPIDKMNHRMETNKNSPEQKNMENLRESQHPEIGFKDC